MMFPVGTGNRKGNMEINYDNNELVASCVTDFNTGDNSALYVKAEGKGISFFLQYALEGDLQQYRSNEAMGEAEKEPVDVFTDSDCITVDFCPDGAIPKAWRQAV